MPHKLGMLLWALVLMAGCSTSQSTQRSDTARLPGCFPVLERLGVRAFRDQDWCQNILYRDGAFSKSSHPSTCDLFQEQAVAFTDQALRDFQQVASAVRATGVEVYWLNTQLDEEGRVIQAEFALSGLGRRTYVYQPAYGKLPDNLPGELEHTAVDSDWYLVEEDWN